MKTKSTNNHCFLKIWYDITFDTQGIITLKQKERLNFMNERNTREARRSGDTAESCSQKDDYVQLCGNTGMLGARKAFKCYPRVSYSALRCEKCGEATFMLCPRLYHPTMYPFLRAPENCKAHSRVPLLFA